MGKTTLTLLWVIIIAIMAIVGLAFVSNIKEFELHQNTVSILIWVTLAVLVVAIPIFATLYFKEEQRNQYLKNKT